MNAVDTAEVPVTVVKPSAPPVRPRPLDAELPDAFAPLIRNAWYVVGELKKIGRTLTPIRVLGEPLVLYRTEAGEPVVLDDRCAHRRYPLSKSKLVGDGIQCGYHGFTYAASGACTWAPGVPVTPKFGVRRYPSAAKGPWLWAWMGEPELADPATIPYPDLEPDDWHFAEGYKHNPGNYMLLIENLLDLTHIHFLHGAEVSDLSEADNPPQTVPGPPNTAFWRKLTPSVPMGFFATLFGGDPTQRVSALESSRQYGPSLNVGAIDWQALPGDDRPVRPGKFRVFHCLTPVDEYNTHQFVSSAFNGLPNGGMQPFMDFSENVVFEQDANAIADVQANILADRRSGQVEFGIPSDRFGIGMRRILRQLKAAEQAR